MKNNIKKSFNSFVEMLAVLPDDVACREYLEQKIWEDGKPVCPYCGSGKHYVLITKKVFKGMYKCAGCKQRYNVLVGTMFEGSHIPLRKWFIAIYIFSMHKKGISSHQLASDLDLTQKTAWYLLSRIRYAFSPKQSTEKIDGLFHGDESFVGERIKTGMKIKK